MTAKRFVITVVLGGLVLLFLAVFALGVMREAPGTNSYALLAQGWLDGRFDTTACFDSDCAVYEGKRYIIFPPAPAAVALPFVAAFGPDFVGFLPLALVALALSALLWWRIAERETGSRDLTTLAVLMIVFATPLAFVILRSDRVWFWAQSWGFLFVTAAIYLALVRRNALLTGLFIGLAFLSRQMTILLLPFLYVLMLDRGASLLRIDGAVLKRLAALAVFPLVALAVYFAYNAARFGSPMETGYAYIFPVAENGTDPNFLRLRVQELGIFSGDYFLFNAIYMFIAGPHVEFAGRYLTDLASFDRNGASLFLVTPMLLLAFLARWDRAFWIGLPTAGVILGMTLFYHSNGFTQYSAQRYALDWLPILLVFFLRGIKPEYTPPLAILVAYAMAVTLSMIVLGGILAA